MLETARLTLRPPRLDDAETLQEINRLGWKQVGNRLRSIDETRAQIVAELGRADGTPGWYQYVVERRDMAARPPRVIGRVAIHLDGPGERQAEIGYGLLPEHFGHGYGSEAVARVLDELFETSKLHRVVAITGLGNAPSRRLLEQLGFRLEGETRESFFHHAEQRFVDEAIYALLAREWAIRRA
ncbi:MAG: GNAT family N-acetyltransferase [Sphingomonadaceae bacterium]|nr:GNAT family N-acetyltransferase [Sphingomonadaceae bacterium]